MREVKFLHCADLHLDMPFTTLGAGSEKSFERRQDIKEVFGRIIDTAIEENVQLILISGDLYEHEYVKKSTINYINDRFSEIKGVEVVIIPGNHDPYTASSFYKNFSWSPNVHILTEENPCYIVEEIGVSIYGIGFSSMYGAAKGYGLRPGNPSHINILLCHGTVDMEFGRDAYNSISSENLALMEMDYIALGHFHKRIENAGGYGCIYNPGSPEALGFDEPGEHGVFIGKISKDSQGEKLLDVRFLAIGKRNYETIEINVNDCNNDEKVIKKILEMTRNTETVNKLLSVILRGYVEKGYKINTGYIRSILAGKFFYIKLKDETTADYNFDELRKEPGLRGLYTRKILSRIEKTEDEYEKKLLMKALYFGLEALEQGKVEIG